MLLKLQGLQMSPDENKSMFQATKYEIKNTNGYRGYLVPTRGHDISLHVPLYKYNVPLCMNDFPQHIPHISGKRWTYRRQFKSRFITERFEVQFPPAMHV